MRQVWRPLAVEAVASVGMPLRLRPVAQLSFERLRLQNLPGVVHSPKTTTVTIWNFSVAVESFAAAKTNVWVNTPNKGDRGRSHRNRNTGRDYLQLSCYQRSTSPSPSFVPAVAHHCLKHCFVRNCSIITLEPSKPAKMCTYVSGSQNITQQRHDFLFKHFYYIFFWLIFHTSIKVSFINYVYVQNS